MILRKIRAVDDQNEPNWDCYSLYDNRLDTGLYDSAAPLQQVHPTSFDGGDHFEEPGMDSAILQVQEVLGRESYYAWRMASADDHYRLLFKVRRADNPIGAWLQLSPMKRL